MKNLYVQTIAFIAIALLSGCAKEKKQEHMSAHELSQKAMSCLKKNDSNGAIAHLEQIISRYPEDQNIARYKMLLAEAYFKDKSFAAAQEVYEHFNQFYPSDKRAEYSKYKSLLSMFYQTLPADCDQTKTDQTIQLCREYLQNPNFKRYRNDVIEKKMLCENKLVDKELYVFNFYVKHENYDAARNRLKHLKEKYLPSNKALEDRILYHECKLAQKEKNMTLVKQHVDTLRQTYPTSKFTQMAQALTVQHPFQF
jgi:outer membrane assembly lipoprotein YfiO